MNLADAWLLLRGIVAAGIAAYAIAAWLLDRYDKQRMQDREV